MINDKSQANMVSITQIPMHLNALFKCYLTTVPHMFCQMSISTSKLKEENILHKLFYHMAKIFIQDSMSSQNYESTNYNHIG